MVELKILPSETDPAIKNFNWPHFVYFTKAKPADEKPDAAAERHQLLLWLPGTQPPGTEGKGAGGAGRFCEIAARAGYRALILKYPNDESATVCQRDADPNAFENFRMTLIAGGRSRHIAISRADSIENRLIKLLLYLKATRADEDWGQFLTDGGAIKWEAVAVAGQSQGGGHAALLGIKHRVARVICTGAPKDYSIALGRPAAWLAEKSATPMDRFFAFNHQQDYQGCSPAEQRENLRTLKLEQFGAPANVDVESPPFHHSHILTTNYPGKKLESKEAHTSVMNPRNEAVFGKVWTYLLTEDAP